jgi:hypothetical protein
MEGLRVVTRIRTDRDMSDWSWADPDGVVSEVDEWELVSSLTSGTFAHYTLVWKPGWKTWLPACQVGELAGAIPSGKTETAVEPTLDDTVQKAPPPPLERYDAYRKRDTSKLLGGAAKLLSGGKAKASLPPPPPPPGSMPLPKRVPAAPPAARRPPMPTLVEAAAAGTSATATLRPPAAVPPPPRAVPSRLSDPGAQAADAAPTAAIGPAAPILRAAATPLPPAAPIIRAAPTPLPPAPAPTAALPPPAAPAARTSSSMPWILIGLLGVGLLGIGGVVVGALLRGQLGGPTIAEVVPSNQTTSSGSGEATQPCRADRPAKKLADSIYLAIPPYVGGSEDKSFVGFAASPNDGIGIELDLTTLSAKERFNERSPARLTGIVPLTKNGPVRFQLDSADDELKFARSVDAKPSFAIGVSDENFARQSGGSTSVIWAGGGAQRMTEPRIASYADLGHVVTFRQGGQNGKIRVGWLKQDGARASDLSVVDVSASHVGTPMVAANDQQALVAFAAKATPDSYWRVYFSRSEFGKAPGPAAGFRIPPGGPGAEAISPGASGVPGGRWLVQWTEGSSGNRVVRLQTLAHDLIQVGDPVDVSPEGANAGQGVVWLQNGSALSLFLVKSGARHELWGATLKCP